MVAPLGCCGQTTVLKLIRLVKNLLSTIFKSIAEHAQKKISTIQKINELKEEKTTSKVVCKLVRVPDDAYPLRVACAWKKNGERRHLVLQENDTGDILWDMFEIPELENFLKILNDEEKQYSFRIRQKYDAYR
ncbi:unnamed protein product [Toxocara canis]|uniref:SARAH domain-containing protein n=1 Tax=Toxocara canis TaxID=6265 RepID=A0A183UXH8_TOXCA|nr:unnamed protein product [Toxocara canis]